MKEMKAIGFFNNKGGVGKTTLLCNLAAYLAEHHNKRILVIDADPQANASQLMIPEDKFEEMFSGTGSKQFTIHSIAHPLASGKGFTQSIEPFRSDYYGVDIIVGDSKLALVEDILAQDWGQVRTIRGMRTTLMFRQLLQHAQNYDLVFFDMSPSLGAINRAVLLGCDAFILPMSTDIFSIRATENIAVWLSKWRSDFVRSVDDFSDSDRDELEVGKLEWKLHLLGYVTQQYNQKSTRGIKRAVKSYDKIISRIPEKIEETLVAELADRPSNIDFFLGTVPHLYSLIPMSQVAAKPIHKLKAEDGIVGSHFSRVKSATQFFSNISDRVLQNLEALDD